MSERRELRRAVFLDRDGTINRAIVRDGRPYPPRSLAEVEILPGVREALQALKARGFVLVVVTNQPDVVTGLTTREFVEAVHRILSQQLPLDRFMVCYDTDRPESTCYKPKPGMLLQAAAELDIDLSSSFMVGDRWRDVKAGKAAGCRTFFIDYGYDEPAPEAPDHVVRSLAEASRAILGDQVRR